MRVNRRHREALDVPLAEMRAEGAERVAQETRERREAKTLPPHHEAALRGMEINRQRVRDLCNGVGLAS